MPSCSSVILTADRKRINEADPGLLSITTFNHLMKGESMEREEKVIEVLRERNWHFRHLEKLHEELDQSLQVMGRRRVLTPQEEIQKKEFQKKKLAAKDEMVEMIRQCKTTGRTDFQRPAKRLSIPSVEKH